VVLRVREGLNVKAGRKCALDSRVMYSATLAEEHVSGVRDCFFGLFAARHWQNAERRPFISRWKWFLCASFASGPSTVSNVPHDIIMNLLHELGSRIHMQRDRFRQSAYGDTRMGFGIGRGGTILGQLSRCARRRQAQTLRHPTHYPPMSHYQRLERDCAAYPPQSC